MQLQKINNIKIHPLIGGSVPIDKVRAGKLFAEAYSNIYLLAKKKSGKTTVISEILRRCTSKRTNVVIFCSTVNKDATYKEIIKGLKEKGCNVIKFTSINEDGSNKLDEIIKEIEKGNPDDDEEEDLKGSGKKEKVLQMKYIMVDDDDEEDEKEKEKKDRLLTPEWIFIFDDLGEEMKSPSIESLLKKNRHFKSKCILSSQWLTQLRPGGIQQIDYMLMWGRIPENKLKETYAKLDLGIDYVDFYALYQNATAEKFNFLYIDVRNEKFRKNFNQEYLLD